MDDKDVNTHNSKSVIDYFKYIPLIYPILVFFGYINYDFYYRKFDIEIFKFLSINEFLFSFISIAYPIIFLIISFQGVNIYSELINTIHSDIDEVRELKKYQKDMIFGLNVKTSLFTNRFIKAKVKFSERKYLIALCYYFLGSVFFIFFMIVSFLPAIILFTGFYLIIIPLYNFVNLEPSKSIDLDFINTSKNMLITVFIWFILFIVYLLTKLENNKIEYKTFKNLIIATTSCLIISTIMRYQDIKANEFEYKKIKEKVDFIYEEEKIESNSEKRLLGMTAEYLFLRDIKTKTNYIYKLSDVKNLQITNLEEVE